MNKVFEILSPVLLAGLSWLWVKAAQLISAKVKNEYLALDRAWERYHGNVEALVKEGVTENRDQVVAAIRKHAQVIESLRVKMA